jgi:hypothetical protein
VGVGVYLLSRFIPYQRYTEGSKQTEGAVTPLCRHRSTHTRRPSHVGYDRTPSHRVLSPSSPAQPFPLTGSGPSGVVTAATATAVQQVEDFERRGKPQPNMFSGLGFSGSLFARDDAPSAPAALQSRLSTISVELPTRGPAVRIPDR